MIEDILKKGSNNTIVAVGVDVLRDVLTEVMRNELKRSDFQKEVLNELDTMTREEVAKRLGVTFTTLWRWNKIGYLMPKKVGSKVLYLKSDIDNLIKGDTDHEEG